MTIREVLLALWNPSCAPLIMGSALHLLIRSKKRDRIGFYGFLVLAAISLLTGVLFRYVGVAYYAVHDVAPKEDVINLLLMVGSSLGFGGLMWMTRTAKENWDMWFRNKMEGNKYGRERYEDREDRRSDYDNYSDYNNGEQHEDEPR